MNIVESKRLIQEAKEVSEKLLRGIQLKIVEIDNYYFRITRSCVVETPHPTINPDLWVFMQVLFRIKYGTGKQPGEKKDSLAYTLKDICKPWLNYQTPYPIKTELEKEIWSWIQERLGYPRNWIVDFVLGHTNYDEYNHPGYFIRRS